GCPAPPPQDALRLDPGRHLGALPGDGDLVASGRVVDPLVDGPGRREAEKPEQERGDRKSTRLNSSHEWISYAVFCLKKKRRPNQIGKGAFKCLESSISIRSIVDGIQNP